MPAHPLRVKDLSPPHVVAAIADDPRLILPVGGCQPVADTLPLGCDTLILEHLADDLSAQFQILRAPTLEYGATAPSGATLSTTGSIGGCVRKKTLHHMLNDLLTSWEAAGMREFVLLSADGTDGHQEALATVVTAEARVRVVDVFAMPLGGVTRDQIRHALIGTLAPTLVAGRYNTGKSGLDGRMLYEQIRGRIAERVLTRETRAAVAS